MGSWLIFALAGLNLQARTLGGPPLPVRTQPQEMLRTARRAPRSCEASQLDQTRVDHVDGSGLLERNKNKSRTCKLCQHAPTLQCKPCKALSISFHTKALHELSKVKGTCEICRCKKNKRHDCAILLVPATVGKVMKGIQQPTRYYLLPLAVPLLQALKVVPRATGIKCMVRHVCNKSTKNSGLVCFLFVWPSHIILKKFRNLVTSNSAYALLLFVCPLV